jgi:hypothetical protein
LIQVARCGAAKGNKVRFDNLEAERKPPAILSAEKCGGFNESHFVQAMEKHRRQAFKLAEVTSSREIPAPFSISFSKFTSISLPPCGLGNVS